MACRYREELVGKRFISVRSPVKLKINKISEWEWRSGIVRAISTKDTSSLDLSVLIEFDDIDWTRREWIRVHDIFQLFLVEHTLVWAERPDPDKARNTITWPGLSFRAVVDRVGLSGCKRKPVEFLVDKFLGLVEEKEIQIFQEGEENTHPTARVRLEVKEALKGWLDYQDGQKILLTTPTVLVGYRLEVYRAEGTTQWYTAVIQSYNHTSKTLAVTDDTVLEEHNEDPTLIQMQLIDDGGKLVDSILRGVEIGITPRRRPRQVNREKEQVAAAKTALSASSTPLSNTVSRSSAVRKPRQQASLSPAPAVSPAPDVDKAEKVSEKIPLRTRPAAPRDRKRRVEPEQVEESSKTVNQSINSRKRTKSEEPVKVPTPVKPESKQASPAPAESPVRVSPRNTPAKEYSRSRERDRSRLRTTREGEKAESIVKSERTRSVEKNRDRSKSVEKRSDKSESSDSGSKHGEKSGPPLSKSKVRSRTSASERTDSPRGSNVSKTSSSPVTKPSGSRKSRSDTSAKVEVAECEPAGEDCSPPVEKDSSSSPSEDKLAESVAKEKCKAEEVRSVEAQNCDELTAKCKDECSPEKQVAAGERSLRKKKSRKKESEGTPSPSKTCTDLSLEEGNNSKPSKERDKSEVDEDNMHYIKKKQLLISGGLTSGKPQSSAIQNTNIDVNHSVTDQIARAEKLSSLNGEEKASGSTSSTLSSPVSDSNADRLELLSHNENSYSSQPRENKSASSGATGPLSAGYNSNTNSSWPHDERSQSRNSDERCSSGLSDEVKRPGCHVDDLRSSKNSPASSPLIIDKAEPVHPYRDPELMRKNPVQSNVPSMINPNKSSTYPTVHNPIPTNAGRPASVGMTSTPLTSSHTSSRTPVIPSVAYPSPIPLGASLSSASLSSLLPPGLHQLDPAALAIHQRIAAAQQHHINTALAQYTSAQYNLSMSYPPHGSLNSAQLEHLWQQKYPSVPIPPPWLLAKHQDELILDARLKQEQLERERLERDRLERERDRLERDRLDRERERKERERRMERDRQEKERIDRERRDREKAEQERAERERLEREKIEKERQERERRERERAERERAAERSRILKESTIDSQAAVEQHFSESLRLAKQRAAQTGMWPSPSITLGTGKPKGEAPSLPSPYSHVKSEKSGEIKPDEKIKQELRRETDFTNAELMRRQHAELLQQREEYLKQQLMQQQMDVKNESSPRSTSSDMKPAYGFSPSSKGSYAATTTASGPVKQEGGSHNFSLYGYQPEKYSYITAEQLHSYGLDKIKNEKNPQDTKPGSGALPPSHRSQSPRKKDMSAPPPLIKDSNKSHSSVIVENKLKESMKSTSPHAHQQYGSPMPLSWSSPHQQPKPAHTPERSHDRSLPSSSSPGSSSSVISQLMSASMASSIAHSHLAALKAAEAARQGAGRSQSPLRVASPHQLSQAVMQPMDYRCSPNTNKSRGSPGSTGSPHTTANSSSISVSGTYTPAIAQAPVSLPQSSVAFSYSLIQQGLVPNPIYTHSSSGGKTVDSQRTVLVTGTAQVPRAAHSPHTTSRPTNQASSAIPQGTKRKSNKDGSNRKRPRGGGEGALSPGSNALNLSIPETTPQIMTNPSPYTTTNTSSVSASSMSSTSSVAATSSPSSTSQAASSMPSSNAFQNRLSGFGGFMDSFKSFVENTVQNAFLSDPDLCKTNKMKDSSSQQQQQQQQHHLPQQQQLQQQQQQQQQQISPPQPLTTSQQQHQQQQQQPLEVRSKSSLERSSTPVTSSINMVVSPPVTMAEDASNLSTLSTGSNSNNNHNHSLSYEETINRVANGQLDTDSDTLSAPSPPPQIKMEVKESPSRSAKHPNLKKAWLQRHSDEDKQEVNTGTSPPVPVAEEDSQQKKEEKEVLKNCYVNCSYISPSKEGGSKSPISALQTVIPNGNMMDESTTSASETETLVTDTSAPPRKRVKTKKVRSSTAKKAKTESDDSSTNTLSSSSTPSQSRKKSSNRRHKEPKDSSKAKVPTEPSPDVSSNGEEEKMKKSSSTESCQDLSKDKVAEDVAMAVTEEEEEEEAEDHHMGDDSSQSRQDCPSPESPDKSLDMTPSSRDASPGEGSKASSKERREKKKANKEKKEKKIREKERKEREEQQDDEDYMEFSHPHLPPPPSILKDTETKTTSTFAKPLVRAPMSTLKKTCEPFLQDDSCSEVTPRLMKCRECKMTPTQRSKNVPNIFCRFYAFRRLKYSQRGFLTIDGFSELTDADQEDINPWIPHFPVIEPRIDSETSKFILMRVGHKFCELVQQEREATTWAGNSAKIAWKRAVTGVREMCDACDTTLFNMHWVCRKCGFVVCLDCYKVKAAETDEDSDNPDDEDGPKETQREWLTCSSNRQPHDVDKLMLTQIIPRDALWEVGRLIHDIAEKWNIPLRCVCQRLSPKNGIKQSLMKQAIKQLPASKSKKLVNGIGGEEHLKSGKTKNGNIKNSVSSLAGYHPDSSSPLSLLADVASMDSENSRERSESPFAKKKEGKHGKSYNPITEPVSPCMDGDGEKKTPASCSTLRELLTKTAGKVKNNGESNKKKSKNSSSLDDIIQSVVEKQLPKEVDQLNTLNVSNQPMKLLHYTPRNGPSSLLVRDTPILIHNLTETSVMYPDVPHSWLCDGRLLRLHDPRHKGNLKIFMEQWKRGQPVLVSGVDKALNLKLWHPKVFSKQFGEIENDLINCRTGCLVVGQPMKHFWDGFTDPEERLVDEDGVPMLLKLKDWPPGDDFSDVLPEHFADLMQALPLPEYTRRDGRLNLASRLPDFLVKPDLGPKMYNAYGSAQFPKEGTTNLHLDVSDATNVMVHVGITEDIAMGSSDKEGAALKAMDKAGVDTITKRRVREVREVAGALWHIFDAVDADKMRDFLNKVAKERGEEIELNHDPIHDQSWYLDEGMRDRLAKEYGVLGYTIIQCLGDAVFIPAGAPHQVRNLNNCIKVAEDFVSPEHLHHCFHLTQEFRDLSDGHSNHEDKLQVKNIVYHAVKDAIAVLKDNDPEEDD